MFSLSSGLLQILYFQVCYGMIYGIGSKALGEQLGLSENDAAVFVETFLAKYTGIIHVVSFRTYRLNHDIAFEHIIIIIIGRCEIVSSGDREEL